MEFLPWKVVMLRANINLVVSMQSVLPTAIYM